MGMEKLAQEVDDLVGLNGPFKSVEIPNLSLGLAQDIKEAVRKVDQERHREAEEYSCEMRPVINTNCSIKNYTLIIRTKYEDAPNKI